MLGDISDMKIPNPTDPPKEEPEIEKSQETLDKEEKKKEASDAVKEVESIKDEAQMIEQRKDA